MRPWSEMDAAGRVLATLETTPATPAARAVAAVLELHHPARDVATDVRFCADCGGSFPCATVRAVTEAMGVAR